MDTKSRILDEALTLFSEKGYANVYVGEIADRVGIKAPSLYKHFRNKQAIFDAIIEEMEHRFLEEAKTLRIRGNDVAADAGIYRNLSEEQMAFRCPDAKPAGMAVLKDWKLVFRTHATVEPCEGRVS